MSRVLDMIWDAILTTWSSFLEWFEGIAVEPSTWVGLGLAVLLLVLVLVVISMLLPARSREPRREQRPELLVSRGEVSFLEQSSLTELSMHVSNLGDTVVQLLEVALSTDLMPTPQTLEVSALLPAGRSVDINLPTEELHGDSGVLELYFYTPHSRRGAYRLRAGLSWEPWNARFKVEPLEQRIEPARRLASSRLQRRQREEWRRRNRAALTPAPEGTMVEEQEEESTEERSGQRLEFPSDF